MHHYATDTYQHLFPGEKQNQVWQHHVPKLAAANSVLMHGLLALTALHKARRDPSHRDLYRDCAMYHHGVSLPVFQGMVACASTDSSEVIVTYAILLGMWIYASLEVTAERLSLNEILSTVEMVRSTRSVFNLYREAVMKTPIGVFLVPPSRRPLLGSEVSSARDALQTVRRHVEHPSDKRALNHLQILTDGFLAGTENSRSAVGWMASVGEDYWIRLRDHQPHTVLIFASSCLLARASEHECWWLAGWSEQVLLACNEVLSPADKEKFGWDDYEKLIRTCGSKLALLAARSDERAETSPGAE